MPIFFGVTAVLLLLLLHLSHTFVKVCGKLGDYEDDQNYFLTFSI